MRKGSINTFTGGTVLDVHPSKQKSNTTRRTRNFRVITRDNNSFIVTNFKGNSLKGQLPSNYVPIATKDVNGVCYIISAEVLDGIATGKGEIGTFPSPDYTSGSQGNLTFDYRPLMNYAGDGNEFPDKNGPFNSSAFNFTLDAILDIELQNDYDGTINVIFTGDSNPMRIINSGFSVLPGKRFKIIDRSGTTDSNKYSIENFANTIQLIARTTKLMKVDFIESTTGGNIQAGNVQYFFAYGTSDGNETEIIAQSFHVPVFNGDKISNINGGKLTGDKTNKLNRFTLSNIDQSYSYISVYVTISSGMVGNVTSAYKINQRYNINGSSMEFVHNGFEELITIPVSDLTSESVMIDTAGTISQIKGYLVAGNIKEKAIDVDSLRKFSRMIKTGHKEITMDLIGPEDNFSRLFDEKINQIDEKSGTEAWNGAYANPKNVHDKTGYWGGESYPFLCRFLFSDGTQSPLFPCVGIDNVSNNNTAVIDAATLSQIDALDATNGFSTDGKILNSLGIYRFPNRTAFGVGQMYYRDPSTSEGRITVNGVTFKIPALDTDLGGGKTIKDISVGIQFFRGERKKDALIQGTLVDSMVIPSIRHDNANTDEKLWNYQGGLYTESNSMLVPAFAHILESIHAWDMYDTPAKRSNTDRLADGIIPFKFNMLSQDRPSGRDPWTVLNTFKSPFSLWSTDIAVNPDVFSGISSKSTFTKFLYRQTHRARVKTSRAANDSNGDHFSALIPESWSINTNSYNSIASWTQGGMELKNSIGFSGSCYFQCRRQNDGPYYLFRNNYNSYLGLRLDTTIRGANPSTTTSEAGEDAFGLLNQTFTSTFLANVYEGDSQRSADAVRQLYSNLDGMSFFPISGKMYWDNTVPDADTTNTVESKLDGNRKITLFNGDCYIGFTLRKMYVNNEFTMDDFLNKDDAVRIGYTLGLVNEGNYNSAIRSSETVDITEGERQFPYQYATKNPNPGDQFARGNTWRDYGKLESAGHNKGYDVNSGAVRSFTIPRNAPFIQSNWFSRVWHSAQHTPNSFENGYRRFFPGNYKDYSTSSGPITKLITNNDRLYCIQEGSIGTININERIQTGNSTGGPIFVTSQDVLSPINVLSDEIGSKHKNSILSTDNMVYGVSLDTKTIWAALEGSPVKLMSDLFIRSMIDEAYNQENSSAISILSHNIVASWNKAFAEIVFTFYRKESGDYNNPRTFSIMYNEMTRVIHGEVGFNHAMWFKVSDKLYSFGLLEPRKIWEHDSDDVPMNNFYGVQDKSIATFVLNEDPISYKTLHNLLITSNVVMPSKITYRVTGAKSEQVPAYVANNRRLSNCYYKNGELEVTVPKVKITHDKDAEEKNTVNRAASESKIFVGSRIKGKFIIVELEYNTGSVLELDNIVSVFNTIR